MNKFSKIEYGGKKGVKLAKEVKILKNCVSTILLCNNKGLIAFFFEENNVLIFENEVAGCESFNFCFREFNSF